VRAVLDPNVLISALLSQRGAPAQILLRWVRGEFELVVSEALLAELTRALAYPRLSARTSEADAEEFVDCLRQSAVMAADPVDTPARSPDPGDDYLLALAEQEQALLVSGDQHLLGLGDRFPIVAPRAFLDTLLTAESP
jgi:putative PIN family toxin of toxin-antitoxin system